MNKKDYCVLCERKVEPKTEVNLLGFIIAIGSFLFINWSIGLVFMFLYMVGQVIAPKRCPICNTKKLIGGDN